MRTLILLFCPMIFCPMGLKAQANNGQSTTTIRYVAKNCMVEEPEQMPTFKGNVNQWISQNLTYPAVAYELGIEGRVMVKFIIEKDGSLSHVQVLRGIEPALDKEAVNVVKRMPKWNPAMRNGQPIPVWLTLPITFKKVEIEPLIEDEYIME